MTPCYIKLTRTIGALPCAGFLKKIKNSRKGEKDAKKKREKRKK
jgi:hypothetical protein